MSIAITRLNEARTEVHLSKMLNPLLDVCIAQLLHSQPDKLLELVAQHGSPLNSCMATRLCTEHWRIAIRAGTA